MDCLVPTCLCTLKEVRYKYLLHVLATVLVTFNQPKLLMLYYYLYLCFGGNVSSMYKQDFKKFLEICVCVEGEYIPLMS